MDPALVIIRFLHILAAVAWFAIPLANLTLVRLGSRCGQTGFEEAGRLALKRGMIGGLAGILTLATGLVAIFYRGGFQYVQPTIHASMGIVVLMVLAGPLVMRPIGMKLVAAGQAGGPDAPQARVLVKRLAMFGGIMQLLWTVVLFLMVWR